MGAKERRFVAKAIIGEGWRVWDRKVNRWWGQIYKDLPSALLDELNGDKDPVRLVELTRALRKNRPRSQMTTRPAR
jgi:hypothetical protein